MNDGLSLDKPSVRRSFERAAETYDTAAVVQDEVCRRMLARLDYIKLDAGPILDAGTGTGNALGALRARYPAASIVALDIALAMLERARNRLPWWKAFLRQQAHFACADIERLPLASGAFAMVWSNLALQWVNDPQGVFAGFLRVLAPGGLLMFSTFGPDTLKELHHASRGIDRYTHVNRFIDMHQLGDMLVSSGFSDPVMDMEYITLTYEDVRQLMRELKAIGAHNATSSRPAGLTGKRFLEAVMRNYEAFRRDGRLPATFEVVYGHAWKPQPRASPTGHRVIEIAGR